MPVPDDQLIISESQRKLMTTLKDNVRRVSDRSRDNTATVNARVRNTGIVPRRNTRKSSDVVL